MNKAVVSLHVRARYIMVFGDTYPVKDILKKHGFKWMGNRWELKHNVSQVFDWGTGEMTGEMRRIVEPLIKELKAANAEIETTPIFNMETFRIERKI